jgi:hypothetical protein
MLLRKHPGFTVVVTATIASAFRQDGEFACELDERRKELRIVDPDTLGAMLTPIVSVRFGLADLVLSKIGNSDAAALAPECALDGEKEPLVHNSAPIDEDRWEQLYSYHLDVRQRLPLSEQMRLEESVGSVEQELLDHFSKHVEACFTRGMSEKECARSWTTRVN